MTREEIVLLRLKSEIRLISIQKPPLEIRDEGFKVGS
jgi:hypothetical protein